MAQKKKNKKLYFHFITIGLFFSCIILFRLNINAEETSISSNTVTAPNHSISDATSLSETTSKTATLTNSVNHDTSPFWLNLKPKVIEYLSKNINTNVFKYELIGPTMPMKKFIGNVPNAAVSISGFNPNSKSDMQTIIAKAANGEIISIHIKIAKYRNMLISKKNHEPHEILSINNFQTEKRTIPPHDYDLYADAPLGNVIINTKLAIGSPLKKNMLTQHKIIKSGEYIRVISESRHLKLEFRCQAITSGTVGSIITVKCPDINKASVKAKVEDLGLARLL
jgi:flagella basal body P-ring formation protein FlgA